MPVNVELLSKVRDLINKEPRRLRMGEWGGMGVKDQTAPPCGTVACLAGWTVLAATPKENWPSLFNEPNSISTNPWMSSSVGHDAAQLLGIPEHDCPFWKMQWGVPEVLNWIDEQIAKAK